MNEEMRADGSDERARYGPALQHIELQLQQVESVLFDEELQNVFYKIGRTRS